MSFIAFTARSKMLISFVVRKGTNTVANLLPAAPSKQKANFAKWKRVWTLSNFRTKVRNQPQGSPRSPSSQISPPCPPSDSKHEITRIKAWTWHVPEVGYGPVKEALRTHKKTSSLISSRNFHTFRGLHNAKTYKILDP